MFILRHPSQVAATEQQVAQVDQPDDPQFDATKIYSGKGANSGEFTEQPPADMPYARVQSQQYETPPTQPMPDIQDGVDPNTREAMQRWGASAPPPMQPTPTGWKGRLMFGLGQGLRAASLAAAQQPEYSEMPISSAPLISGAATGVAAGLRPGEAIRQQYIREVLPAYMQQEAMKQKMRKGYVDQAKIEQGIHSGSIKDQGAVLDNRLNQGKLQEQAAKSPYLADNAAAAAAKAKGEVDAQQTTEAYRRQQTRESAAREVAAWEALAQKRALNPLEQEKAKLAIEKAKLENSWYPAKVQADINRSRSTAYKNYTGGDKLTVKESTDQAGNDWDNGGEKEAFAAWVKTRPAPVYPDSHPNAGKPLPPDEAAASFQRRWLASKDRDKIRKAFIEQKSRGYRSQAAPNRGNSNARTILGSGDFEDDGDN